MTSTQRALLRAGLIKNGFHRSSYTRDRRGDGSYEEFWDSPRGDSVHIRWAERTHEAEAEMDADEKIDPEIREAAQKLRIWAKGGD